MPAPPPNTGTRFALVAVVLVVSLLIGGATAGVSAADPEEPSTPGDGTSETSPGEPPAGTVPEPEPSAIPAPAPRTLADQLRDILRRPLSIFGNGRTPGEGADTHGATGASGKSSRIRPSRRPHADFGKPPDAGPAAAPPEVPERRPSVAPEPTYTGPPAPDAVPGPRRPRLSVDPAAPSAVERTLRTFSALIDDACAPHRPAPPEPPAPPEESLQRQAPSFKIASEDPVDVDGGAVADAFSTGHGDHLPVLQAPVVPLAPAPRGFPEPIRGEIGGSEPVAAPPNAPAAGPVPPAVTLPGGSAPAELGPPGTGPAPAGRPAPREGSQRTLTVARAGELFVVALPGLIGLVAITAFGGVLGHRQASAARYLRDGSVRYLR